MKITKIVRQYTLQLWLIFFCLLFIFSVYLFQFFQNLQQIRHETDVQIDTKSQEIRDSYLKSHFENIIDSLHFFRTDKFTGFNVIDARTGAIITESFPRLHSYRYHSKISLEGETVISVSYEINFNKVFLDVFRKNVLALIVFFFMLFLIIFFTIHHARKETKSYRSAFQFLKSAKDGSIEDLTMAEKVLDSSYKDLIVLFQEILDYIKGQNELKVRIAKSEALFSLASSVAHDIRSPIAVLEAALSEEKIDDTLVRQAANRLKSIADGLLKERKGEHLSSSSAEPTPTSTSTSINTILENLIREKSVEHPNHKIIATLKEDHLLTKETTGLVRALSNFINNAVEASARESEIFITHAAGVISIRDMGCGLTKEQLDKIGTAPIQTTKQNGNGLGVYSSVEAIKELGGRVTFASLVNSPLNSFANAGTTVTITFHRPENSVTLKTVLVDDDDLIRMVWTSRAKKRGENFRAYSEPQELLNEIDLYGPSTIFYLDVNIKEESGVDLAEKLFAMGFHELYLATGEEREKFEGLTFIKGVVGKDGT